MVTRAYKIHGMDCSEEVAALRRALRPLIPDPDTLQFDLMNAKLTVRLPADQPTDREIISAVARTGMKAAPWDEQARADAGPPGWRAQVREVLCALSGTAFAFAYAVHALRDGWYGALVAGEGGYGYPPAAAALYLLATAAAAWFVLPKAWAALRTMRADIHLLMVVAVSGALGLGNFFEGALVAFLFALAQLLESWSVGRARAAIKALMDLTPETARFRCPHDGCVLEKPVAQVPVGAEVLLRPGDRAPLDGVILTGETTVNQAPITGESAPIYKQPGDTLYAGSVNNEGAVSYRSTRPASDSSIARIIRMVEEAQSRRAPVEQWVTRFASYYTPAMILGAIGIALGAPWILGATVQEAIYLACVMLLIACPCALVISTPVSIVAGLSAAARAGVLIKGGVYLELPGQWRAIAIDKTGTLSTGAPRVQAALPLNGETEASLMRIAAAIESGSNHPFALAIQARAEELGIPLTEAGEHRAIPGKGVQARLDGAAYWLGSERLLREHAGIEPEALEPAAQFEDAGHSVVLLARDRELLGIISIADAIRPQAAAAVAALKEAGIAHVAMLTGDNERTAREVARLTGVDACHAGLLPEDKVRLVAELTERHGRVGMVGDGINDAPALAAASTGVAMGAAGSDAAIETADIALMSGDLGRLPWLVQHSRRTLRVIRQNIAIALGLKALVMALAVAGFATLWLAIVADMGASLIVIFNALRLLEGRAA